MSLDADPPAELVARLRAAGCVFAEEEAALLVAAAGGTGELAGLTARRVAGEPLEQVLGRAEFAGLRIALAPGVFVPRRRTELLVRLAVEGAGAAGPGAGAGALVVDLCCGSGAVGAAVAAAVPGTVLHAADVDPAAVACARVNLSGGSGSGSAGTVHLGDLYDALPAALRGRVDVLVANAPYVPTDEVALMPPEARLHEPRRALDGGADGLDLARRVVAGAPDWLAPAGRLVVETSARQADALRKACAAAGLDAVVVRSEELDATAVVGRRMPEGAQ